MALAHRYDRNHAALSPEESAALSSGHVAVCGCGGLGGYCIEELARIGIGHLTVIDGDVFEESNLNRQLLATEGLLGVPKVQGAIERVHAINSEVEVMGCAEFIDEGNASRLLAGADCVVDALDSPSARFMLARSCGALGLPLVYGAIAGWFGQVCTVFPGDASFATVYGVREGRGIEAELGNLPFTAACTASFQGAEVVKVLLGREGTLRNRMLMIDLLGGSVEEISLT